MITEDYASFEIAKLLREKGFGGECLSMYVTPKPRSGMGNPNEAKLAPHGRDSHYYKGYIYQCEAPTLQVAMKWLREVHNIVIVIDVCRETEREGFYCWQLEDSHTGDWIVNIIGECPSYEEAVEAAIEYCLENLI